MRLLRRCKACKGFTCTQTDFFTGIVIATRVYWSLIHCHGCYRFWAVKRDSETYEGAAHDEDLVGTAWLREHGFEYLTKEEEDANVGG